jgi:Protein of unknown function (DUF3050)
MSRYQWDKENSNIKQLKEITAPARDQVIAHSVYTQLNDLAAVQTFMEHHVFAVWDFMSLLKSLQRELTCVQVPWVPSGPSSSRRLINDIVLVEESDELGDGFISHFELYLQGMAQAGADTRPIEDFLVLLRNGGRVTESAGAAGTPTPAIEFIETTWGFIENSSLHGRAAAFAFGREDLIPDMFHRVVTLNEELGNKLSTFVDYLRRHIQVDEEEHTPMAMQMLADLCGDDKAKWAEAEQTVIAAFSARVKLWDGIQSALPGRCC